jgi:hypothetical protein
MHCQLPDAADLRRFVDTASSMDGLRIAELLREKMVSVTLCLVLQLSLHKVCVPECIGVAVSTSGSATVSYFACPCDNVSQKPSRWQVVPRSLAALEAVLATYTAIPL